MSQQHDFAEGTPSKVSVGNTTTELLSATSGRRYAILVNDSNETIYISLGSDAVINSGIRLNAGGGSYTISGDRPFRGAINGICTSGGKNISIFEA